MKRKTTGLVALALTAAIALSACGASAREPSETASVKDESVPAEASESAAVQAEPMDASASAETFSDAFSSRDLSGTWDASSAVLIALNGDSISCDSSAVTVSGSSATITAAGTYRVTGTLENGSLIADAGKEDKIQIVLDGASIHSDTFAAIYVKQADKVFLTLADGSENALSNGGTFETIDENNVDGAVFSKDDLTLNGNGKLVVTSPAKHGVVSKDDLVITGGTYEITAGAHALSGKNGVGVADGALTLTAGKDGIHAENDEDSAKGCVYLAGGTIAITAGDDGVTASGLLQMDGGSLDVTASEGMEGNYIRVNDGAIRIQASDDGINAARKSGAGTPTVEINGGDISVTVGAGDTDGIDANGNLIITGGTISVNGNSAFDIDGTVSFTGGTVIINGQRVDSIPNQMGGGRGGFGAAGRKGGGRPADGQGRPADAQTGATPDMKPNRSRGTSGNADNPNGTQENGTQEGVMGRKGKDGKRQRNTETPSPAPSAPDNAAFI